MSINPNAPDRLAQEAQATGGLLSPLQGNDVLNEQMALDLERNQQINPEEGVEVAGLGELASQVGNLLRRGAGKALSPKDDVLNKALEKLQELEAGDVEPEAVKPNPLENVRRTQKTPDASLIESLENEVTGGTGFSPQMRQAIDEARRRLDEQELEPSPLETNPIDSPEEMEELGFGEEFDQSNADAYEGFARGNTWKIDDSDAADVLASIKNPRPVDGDGMLSDFRAVGSRGDEKIPDEGNVLSTIEAISQQYKGEITEAKRGEITQDVTRQMADLLGMDQAALGNAILNRPAGSVINIEGQGLAETMLAARDLLISEIKKLDELAKKAEFGGDQEALQFRSQLELVAQLQFNIKGSQTEIARALGSFKIPARSGAGDTEMMRAKDLTSMLEDFGGTGDIREMAKAYNQQATAVHQKAKFAQLGSMSKFGRFSDAMYEAWINLLLSSPITHFKNTVGAALTTFANIPETYVAAGIGAARRGMGGAGGTTFTQGNAQIFGIVMAMTDAFAGAGRAFRTGERVVAGTKIEGFKGSRPGKAFSSEGMQEGGLATAVDILGNIMTLGRIPTRLLEAEDTFFKVIATRMSLYENALSTGKAQGLEGDALASHIANFLYDPPATAIETSEAFAKYATLQTDLDAVGKSFSNMKKVPGLRYFVPFLKTPYNAFKYVFRDRTPLGLMSAEIRSQISRGFQPGATQLDKQVAEMAIARMSLGSGAALVMGGLAAQGHISGAGPADPGMQANLRAQGWRPYSIRVPGSVTDERPLGEWVSYMAFEPFTTTLMIGADASELMMDGTLDEATYQEIAGHVAAVFAHQLTDKTFMSGFSNLVSTLQDPTRYAGSTLDNFIRSGVPRVVAQVKKSGVPGVLEGDPVVRNARTALDQIKSQIPGFSETLPPRRNHFGQVRVLDGSRGPDLLSPFYSSAVGSNDFNTSKDYNKRVVAVSQIFADIKYSPKMPGKMLMGDRMGGELMEKIELSPEEESRYHQVAGVFALQGGIEGFKMLGVEELLKSEGIQQLIERTKQGDDLAREILHTQIDTVFRNARNLAKAYMLTADPTYSDSLSLKMQKRMDDATNLMETFNQ